MPGDPIVKCITGLLSDPVKSACLKLHYNLLGVVC